MNGRRSFLAELKRRNVLRAAVLYIGAVWALAQGIAQLGPLFNAPNWAMRGFVIACAIGFPFWIAFAWFYEFTPHGIQRESAVAADAPSRHSTARRLDFAIIGILAIAVVLLVTSQFVLRRGAASVAGAAAVQPAMPAPAKVPEKSVAVLPLVNASPDKDQVYFSDGLSEDLINTLSQFQGLKVISAQSSFQFRGARASAQEIGSRLGVAHLVEGTVQRAGDTVRITAQLVNAADGSVLWSEHYDRPYKDLFALQDAISRAIAGALQAKLLPGTALGAQGDRPPSGNLDAYAAFLRGTNDVNATHGAVDVEPGIRNALAEFATAIRLDPRYAAAIANESNTWLNYSMVLSGAARRQAIAKARELAAQAQALDPDNVKVLNVLANLHSNIDHDWTRAVAEYRRAIQVDPQGATAVYGNLGALLTALGRPGEAAALQREALQNDPLSAYPYIVLSSALLAQGQLDAAAAAARKMAEVHPGGAAVMHAQLAQIEVLRGNAAAALAEARQIPIQHREREWSVTLALQIGSARAAADAALRALIARPATDLPYYGAADVYALRKEPDQMFAWLDRALDSGENLAMGGNSAASPPGLLADPFLKPYRRDPRFAALCKQLGLPVPGDTLPDAAASVEPAASPALP